MMGERCGSRATGLVIALFGPTGVGKTAVALRLGTHFETRVISCDSMQIYRDFSVLTNQPTPAERALVPHELVGVAGPEEEWSAALYGERAQGLIEADIRARGRALVVGGTGLWLRAALAPLAIPDVHDPALREELNERGAREGAQALHRELASLDPAAAQRIHPSNLRRVTRALEVALTLGPGVWSARDDLWTPVYRHPTLIVGLTMERSLLYERINRRASAMVRGGAVEEVRRHRAERRPSVAEPGAPALRGGPCSRAAGAAGGRRGVSRAIGYREIADYLEGRATLDHAESELAAATRRYARRQLTWMRKLGDAVIIDVSERHPGDVAAEITELATRKEPAD
ncbi:MAG: tRNA (adenosine(37)-N6)-dimethylallyltransferase MiaA [Thermoleophilia bacterium]